MALAGKLVKRCTPCFFACVHAHTAPATPSSASLSLSHTYTQSLSLFLSSSPFADILGDMGSEPPAFYGELTGMQLPHTKSKPPPTVIQHEVTLKELYNSATKKITYTRKKLKSDEMVRLVFGTSSAHDTIHPPAHIHHSNCDSQRLMR